ncbi:MAG: ATP-grasp domain-containing protein, partial [Jatrophihabitantaceae bacterium]
MPRLSVYFNRTYATNAQVIGMLRANQDGRELRVVGTHVDPDSPVLAACDLALPEPELAGQDYVDWALEFTARHDIDVFIPRLELAAIAGQRHRFAAQGVAVLAPPAEAINLFADKAATYADALDRGLAVPPYRVVRDGQSLLAGYAEIRELTGTGCLKPVTGVGADGFRILTDQPLNLADVLGPLPQTVRVQAAAEAIDAAIAAGSTVPPLMVLPFLTGPEISVDVLGGIEGSVFAAIGRAKHGRRRVIVDDPGARAVAE